MSDAYDAGLRALAKEVAEEQGCGSFLQEGVYCMLAGPTYETIAESKVLQTLGADAVGEFGAFMDLAPSHFRIYEVNEVFFRSWGQTHNPRYLNFVIVSVFSFCKSV